MAKKVHELAKEMNLSSKELLEKAHQLGVNVTSHMSVLSDADIDKIKGAKKETKIVKAVWIITNRCNLKPSGMCTISVFHRNLNHISKLQMGIPIEQILINNHFITGR